MRSKLFLAGAAFAALLTAGCAAGFGTKAEMTPAVEREVSAADQYAAESKSLSHLAALELAINDYVKGEGGIPEDLDRLVPKYISEIPTVELGIKGHKDTNQVAYYSEAVIRDGVIDGTKLQDSGKWGYAHNKQQVIIFVDCLHQDSRKKLWYQERGVF